MQVLPSALRRLTLLLSAVCILCLPGCGTNKTSDRGESELASEERTGGPSIETDSDTATPAAPRLPVLPAPSGAEPAQGAAPGPRMTDPIVAARPEDAGVASPAKAAPLRAEPPASEATPSAIRLQPRLAAPLAESAAEAGPMLPSNPLRASREAAAPVASRALTAADPVPQPKAPLLRAEPRGEAAPETPPMRVAEPEQSPATGLAAGGPVQEATSAESVAENRGDYEVVTVFYGTDRSAAESPGVGKRPDAVWFYAAAGCVMLCGLFAAAALAGSRRRLFGALAAMSLSSGAAMGLIGTIAWLQSSGAVELAGLRYGNDRGQLEMGTCEVSIPRGHEVGELEAPSVFRLDLVEDPRKHVVLLGVEQEDPESFAARLRSRVEHSPRKEAFVFIHGFNVTFEDAARRTAQLAYDLDFHGAPVFYSWPSQGGLFQYAVDETNVVWTVPHLKQFLSVVARQSGAESVHLIAHSMGNRALTSALQLLTYEREETLPFFREVVLTAPDIDADVFRRDIAPAIVKTARRVTLYASSNDEALLLSKKVHGYPRAGDSGAGLVVIPGIDTIDVSEVDTSLVGHDYYGSNATVIADLVDLVGRSKSPGDRIWLEVAHLDQLMYWVFRKNRAAVSATPTNAAPRY